MLTPKEFDLILTALMRARNEYADQHKTAVKADNFCLFSYYLSAELEAERAYRIISELEDESRRTQREDEVCE